MFEYLNCKKYNAMMTQKWRDDCDKSKAANPVDWIYMMPQLAFYIWNKEYGHVAYKKNVALWAKTKKEVIQRAKEYELRGY